MEENIWENAPEGAEFFSERLKNYYKHIDGVLYWHSGHPYGDWGRSVYGMGHKCLGECVYRFVEVVVVDEWIEHHGSNNPPVHPDTEVQVQLRMDRDLNRDLTAFDKAGNYRWNHKRLAGLGDIVAYKVAKKP